MKNTLRLIQEQVHNFRSVSIGSFFKYYASRTPNLRVESAGPAFLVERRRKSSQQHVHAVSFKKGSDLRAVLHLDLRKLSQRRGLVGSSGIALASPPLALPLPLLCSRCSKPPAGNNPGTTSSESFDIKDYLLLGCYVILVEVGKSNAPISFLVFRPCCLRDRTVSIFSPQSYAQPPVLSVL